MLLGTRFSRWTAIDVGEIWPMMSMNDLGMRPFGARLDLAYLTPFWFSAALHPKRLVLDCCLEYSSVWMTEPLVPSFCIQCRRVSFADTLGVDYRW